MASLRSGKEITMDGIKYKTGASGLSGSLGGLPSNALSSGFADITPAKLDPWDPDCERCDDGGTNSVGDQYEFRKTGACGRPHGTER